ncbi:MAG TPA: hypothetical protein DIT65_03900 [Cryomorphaceae bacterium]|nr:hypothetical protein [Cryomorphaceae bacterium]|tara:strand:- start:1459 stop:2301 length:843 start_codon:yes stop_codon:yes gene_type:complete
MKRLYSFLFIFLILPACSRDGGNVNTDLGHRMLLIGNSFFRPYAEQIDVVAADEGYVNHNNTHVFRGGVNGNAINFWNDSTTQRHLEVKEAFDNGGIEYFGMTAGGSSRANGTEGFREWIQYGLQENPDMKVFISIPPIDFPTNWTDTAQYYGFNSIESFYDYFVNTIVHQNVIDPLRAEFPNTPIFTIPTGWAAVHLLKMKQDGILLDSVDLSGPLATSLFTDTKGHQGQIIIEAGALMWMKGIYNMDLSSSAYETGFNTDLHGLAHQIMSDHDPLYNQ